MLSGFAWIAAAQECPPAAALAPTGTISGTVGDLNCTLLDGTPFTSYRLDLPVRGTLAVTLSSDAGGLQLILRDGTGARLTSGSQVQRPLEAGSYRLLIDGDPSAQGAAFHLTTSFTAEPSILCVGYPLIGLRQTISNTLGNYGCLAPDGTPYDGWSLNTLGPGTLTVTISSNDVMPLLTLRGSNGRALATSNTGTLVMPLQGDSQYTIVAASDGPAGAYQLTTAFEPLADDPCRSTATFTGPGSDSGAIVAASCHQTIPDSGDQLYYNFYTLSPSAAGTATIRVVSGDFTPTLYLLDEAGNTLALDSLGGGYDTSGNAHSDLRYPLRPGNYGLQVFSNIASGGSYQLEFGYSTDTASACTPVVVSPGDSPTGALSTSSCRTPFGLSDVYTVTLASAGTLDLDLTSPDFDTTLVLRDQKDNVLIRSDDFDGVSAAHISADLPAGTYSAVAAAQSYAGSYRLASKFTAHDVPPCTFTQAIDLNGGYIQRLNAASCKGADGQPVDYYGFTLSADSLALAVVTSSAVDAFLTLFDSSGNPLRSDDNGYIGIDPLIVQYLPAGSYKLAVRSATSSAGGLYQVDLRTVEGPRPALCSPSAPLNMGATVNGNLTYTACQYPDQTFADVYAFTLDNDNTVDLQMASSNFDAYLVLLDAKGNVVDEDDNGGGGTNARIVSPLAAGTYFVVAKPAGSYLDHGSYSLSAKAADSPASPNLR